MQEIVIAGRSYRVEPSKDRKSVSINGESREVDLIHLGAGHHHLIVGGKSFKVEVVDGDEKSPHIKINGRSYRPSVKDETDMLLERLGLNIKTKKEVKELKAPMPGLVLEIRVEIGQVIKEGDPLIVLEAMKMENVLKSPGNAVVKGIAVSKGDAIDKNTLLISFE
ncbi:MAG: biotin/lipoyl-binding protein [Flavobacteriales bacterium]|nr:biotin/lipoyl-binding protein [Flavobacteriales bacterium]